MKGCLRTTIIATGLLLIAVAVAALLLVTQANTWLRSPAETALTAAFGAPCRIEALHFRPLDRCIEANGLVLTKGTAESGLTLKIASLKLVPDPRTIMSAEPALRRVALKGVRLRMHVGAASDVGLLLLGAWGSKPKASDGDTPATPQSPGRWAVRELTCDDAVLEMPDDLDNVPIPPFVIGGPDAPPLPPGELVRQCMNLVVKHAVAAEGERNPLIGILGNALGLLSPHAPAAK